LSGKKLLLGILGIATLLLIAAVAYVGFQILSGRVLIDLGNDPSIRELKAYVNDLTDVQQIEVIYRPKRQWIKEPLRNPEYEEVVLTITDPDEIQQIMSGFKEAERFHPFWTQCGFYIRLDLYGAREQVGTILVGVDDCKSFTTYDIHAVGKMSNDYFYHEYVVPLQENR
jgi:hypothetical protein